MKRNKETKETIFTADILLLNCCTVNVNGKKFVTRLKVQKWKNRESRAGAAFCYYDFGATKIMRLCGQATLFFCVAIRSMFMEQHIFCTLGDI
jgi:hypothetical protein